MPMFRDVTEEAARRRAFGGQWRRSTTPLEKLRAPTNVAWEVRFQTSSVSGLSVE